MAIDYDPVGDVLRIRLSDTAVERNISQGQNITVGYGAEGEIVEITVLDVSKLIQPQDDEHTIVLIERESARLAELINNPVRNERFEAMRAQISKTSKYLRNRIEEVGIRLDG